LNTIPSCGWLIPLKSQGRIHLHTNCSYQAKFHIPFSHIKNLQIDLNFKNLFGHY
jgi:hypothetical protein